MSSMPSTPRPERALRPWHRFEGKGVVLATVGIFLFQGLCVTASPADAGAIYIWKDEAGIVHMTDTRPKDPAELLDVQRYSETRERPVKDPSESPEAPPPDSPADPDAVIKDLQKKTQQARTRAEASEQKAEGAAEDAARLRGKTQAFVEKAREIRPRRSEAKRLSIEVEQMEKRTAAAEAAADDAAARAVRDGAAADVLQMQLRDLKSGNPDSKPVQ